MHDRTAKKVRRSTTPSPRPRDFNQRRSVELGVPSESCSAEMLGLARFSASPKLFAAEAKGPAERVLNPFGDPWSHSKPSNGSLQVMTSSCQHLFSHLAPDLAAKLATTGDHSDPEHAAHAAFLKNARSPYHYDETVSHLAPSMPDFVRLKRLFADLRIRKKLIGYTVVNISDGYLLWGRPPLPEHAYLHHPEHSLDPADRVRFRDASGLDAGGDVFDIRKADVREMIVDAVEHCMLANGVDAVLIDYAVRRYAFGLPSLADVLPDGWVDAFQESQIPLLRLLCSRLRKSGREVFLNGVMLDSITVTEPELVRGHLDGAAGVVWEQPFRWEWRNYNNGKQDYYQRLDQFFAMLAERNLHVIVKSGTYRFHGTEDVAPDWTSRFGKTDQGIERHLAVYAGAFALLFMHGKNTHFLHTHPTELYDIYCSEAHFQEWGTDIGAPSGPRIEIAPHVHMRAFERGIVLLNNTLDAFRLTPKHRPDGFKSPFPAMTLEPLSGLILPTQERRLSLRARTRLMRVLRLLGIRR
jgi:hypothetical protein